MANDNKKFLDKIGVQYLWDKINEYFSQIGHRHETSDVNGLDEYMEENAKAIRDTEKVIEILPTLPLYPSEEQLGIIYACNGKLYRAKKLNTLTLDFSKIDGDEEGRVDVETLRDFINQNGKNIVMKYYQDGDEEYDFNIGSAYFEKYNNGLYIDNHLYFQFEQRNNSETFDYFNKIYVKSLKITAQSPYNDDSEEVLEGCVDYSVDDRGDVGSISDSFFLNDDFPPTIETKSLYFGQGEQVNLADYINLSIDNNYQPFTLLKLELELVTCNNEDEYNSGITHDFLVWEEVYEEELPIEDTTPATEDTRKRFYREIENNNIYVTDAEYNPGAGGFVIDIVHPKTGEQINNADELREYIDPNQIWTNGVNGIEQIYADNRYWLNDLGERVTITPIRMGTKNTSASICLSIKEEVDLYFSPYISMSYPSQEAVIEQEYTTIEVNDAVAGETNEYEVVLFDNINLLEHKWTIVHVPASTEVYINTNRRCYLHKIVKEGEGSGDRYFWSQVAKIQDIEDKINALPDVARTGCYDDLTCKPCIGDVQTYDWSNDEDLPIIDEGTGNCDNRLKQLLRCNNSLYTAVVNDSGVSIDMRDFSNRYNTTKPEVAGPLTEYIFKTRMDLRSAAAYEDYYVSGSKYMISNTKGIGMQLGSSSDYGEVVVAMRDYDDSKRMLFNNIEVGLQSWSSDGEKTTDNGNVYVEVGTTTYNEVQEEIDVDSNLMLIYDCDWNGAWCLCYRDLTNLYYGDLESIINESGNTLVINGNVYHIDDFEEVYTDERDLTYCHVWLDNYDNLDSDWACNAWINDSRGYDVAFRKMVTEYEQVLTSQKTENVWFKKYSDEYTEEWVETGFLAIKPETIGNYVRYDAYCDECKKEEVLDFVATLNQGDKLKIDDIELTVNYTDRTFIYFDYIDTYPDGQYQYPIYKPQRTYINNPVLKETVKLTGTNCDYIKIWTDEIGEQYGKRCIVKGITFNDLKYEYDPNPTYNRDISKKDYWKQISGSGSGSIKVIDLLDEN